jgi:hypothetical protein
LIEKADRQFDKWWKGQNARPIDIQNAVRSIDSAYQSRLQQADEALQVIETIYPGSQVITTYNRTSAAPIRTQVDTALQQGYSPEEIVREVAKNPLFTDKIGQAINEGYSPLSIINFLKTQ